MKLWTAMRNIDKVVISSYILHSLIVIFSIFMAIQYIPKNTIAGAGDLTNIGVFNYLSRWDGGWYLGIAENGFDKPETAAFFPLYPLMMKVLGSALNFAIPSNISFVVSGLIVSNIAYFGMLIFLYRIALELFNKRIARRTVLFVSIFPTSFFFSSLYTESLFMFFVTGTFYYMYKKEWLSTGLMLLLASLTRNTGIFLIISTFVYYIKVYQWRSLISKTTVLDYIKIYLPVVLGYSGYLTYLYLKFDNPLAFVEAQKAWDRSFSLPWNSLYNSFINSSPDFLFTISFIILLFFGLKKIPFEQWTYTFISIFIPVMSVLNGNMFAMTRFMLMSFPIFIYLALLIKDRMTETVFIVFNVIFLSFLTIMYGSWYWVG